MEFFQSIKSLDNELLIRLLKTKNRHLFEGFITCGNCNPPTRENNQDENETHHRFSFDGEGKYNEMRQKH